MVYTPHTELPVDAEVQREGAKGNYGLDPETAGAGCWARLNLQMDALKAWFASSTNCERSTDPLSPPTLEGHGRTVLYFLG
jgi:hypothetical protein